jgi:hypothetical protein
VAWAKSVATAVARKARSVTMGSSAYRSDLVVGEARGAG